MHGLLFTPPRIQNGPPDREINKVLRIRLTYRYGVTESVPLEEAILPATTDASASYTVRILSRVHKKL